MQSLIYTAELEGYMSWGLWVHAGDVGEEGVPALLDEVSSVWKVSYSHPANRRETGQCAP